MTLARRPRLVRLAMLVLPSLVVLGTVAATGSIAVATQERSIRDAAAERVRSVATSLAALPQVRAALAAATDAGTTQQLATADDLADATAALQPLADLVERAAGVYYVVVTDDEGVRITHPLPSERGVRVATTNASVLAGEEFLGTEVGASGPSLRAKIPVRAGDDEVLGMVAVGVLESSLSAERDEAIAALLPWIVGALLVGTIASSALSAAVERRFRRLDQAAAQHEQVRRTAAALREQSHEFSTRLHVIHGLVSHGDAQEALDYIDGVVPVLSGAGHRGDAPPSAALLDATVEALRAELAALGTRLDVAIDGDVEIDDGVVLVVANLCRNAGEAGATLVRCALAARDGRLRGTVDDDGPGIDPRDGERVFARGFSSKPDTSVGGRGLGLDLVRRTVTARDGMIELRRSPLGGARFAFEMTLP